MLSSTRHVFRADGSGTTESLDSNGTVEKSEFTWQLDGDRLKRTFPSAKITEGRIVRVEEDLFAVRYSKNTQTGYRRVRK